MSLITPGRRLTTSTDLKRVARRVIIGVMGAGENARAIDIRNAFALGSAIANEGWVVLTGGRNRGVMDAANRGAKAAGGLTVGILPTKDSFTPESGHSYSEWGRYSKCES
jgi:uncharacterized protein (TIGR00725 family)